MEFALRHAGEDVAAMALRREEAAGVDLTSALEQIAGRQAARRKLPTWAAMDGIVYPPRLSMEQCSSEETARYKAGVAAGLAALCGGKGSMMDITGGFGVDFSFMAPLFARAVYVERQQGLCDIVRNNLRVLGIGNAEVACADGAEALAGSCGCTLLYMDPARRDSAGQRTYSISDCTPDVLAMAEDIAVKCSFAMVKLSPMLDVGKVVSDFSSAGLRVSGLHIVSAQGECKEIVAVADCREGVKEAGTEVFCADGGTLFKAVLGEGKTAPTYGRDLDAGLFLYEPNAAVMKSGAFGTLASVHNIHAIAANSHLFVSQRFLAGFPGRKFKVEAVSSMNKKELAAKLHGVCRANVAVRNFPLKAEALRARLGLKDGGGHYIFGTTDSRNRRLVLLCRKAEEHVSTQE